MQVVFYSSVQLVRLTRQTEGAPFTEAPLLSNFRGIRSIIGLLIAEWRLTAELLSVSAMRRHWRSSVHLSAALRSAEAAHRRPASELLFLSVLCCLLLVLVICDVVDIAHNFIPFCSLAAFDTVIIYLLYGSSMNLCDRSGKSIWFFTKEQRNPPA